MVERIALIGSRAAQAQGINLHRTPGDMDIVTTRAGAANLLGQFAMAGHTIQSRRPGKWMIGVEDEQEQMLLELSADPSDELLLDILEGSADSLPMEALGVPNMPHRVMLASPAALFWTKRSHVTHAIHWRKNVRDHALIRAHLIGMGADPLRGADIDEPLRRYFGARASEVNEHHARPQANLAQSNEDFFVQYNVNRDYDHDLVHKAVAFREDRPYYLDLKDDESRAWCSWAKFSQLPHAERLKVVQEEAMVIALERFIITHRETVAQVAYALALEALATRMWSGNWSWFIVDHYSELEAMPYDYVTRAREYLKFPKYEDPVLELLRM